MTRVTVALFGCFLTTALMACADGAGGSGPGRARMQPQCNAELPPARYLTFSLREVVDGRYVTRLTHLWDQHTGRFRAEDRPVDNAVTIVLFSGADDSATRVFRDGRQLDGPARDAALAAAQSANRLMTELWHVAQRCSDPDTVIGTPESERCGDDICDRYRFELNDEYRSVVQAWVARERSAFVRTDIESPGPLAGRWDWRYTDVGEQRLPIAERQSADKTLSIAVIAASTSISDADLFSNPAKALVRRR